MTSHSTAKSGKKLASGLAGLEYFGFKDFKALLLRRKWLILTTTLMIAVLVSGLDRKSVV